MRAVLRVAAAADAVVPAVAAADVAVPSRPMIPVLIRLASPTSFALKHAATGVAWS
jgi:hypothetical protein